MKRLRNALRSTSQVVIISLLAGGIAWLLVSLAPADLLKKFEPELLDAEKNRLSNVAFAAALSQHFPENLSGNSSALTKDLSAWLLNNEESPPLPPPWSPWPLIGDLFFSLSACLAAMTISGLFAFLVLQQLITPNSVRSKGIVTSFLLLVSGCPAAVYVVLLTPQIDFFTTVNFETVFSLKLAHALSAWLDLIESWTIICLCLILGDGLMGTFLLRLQTLATGSQFDDRIATEWAGLRFKSPSLPLPGTLAAVTLREVSSSGFSTLWTLLGRFLLSEIALEFVLHVFTESSPPGIGGFLFDCLQQEAPPLAFATAAALLMAPLALSRNKFPERQAKVESLVIAHERAAPSSFLRTLLNSTRTTAKGLVSLPRNMRLSILELFSYLVLTKNLLKPLIFVKEWWAAAYVGGLTSLYVLTLLSILSTAVNWLHPNWLLDLFVSLGWFLLLALLATILISTVGLELALLLARFGRGMLSVFSPFFRFPLIFWVLLILPALPATPGVRISLYFFLILGLTTVWSAFDIGREIFRHANEDFVPSLQSLGHPLDTIFRRHILFGHCREFVITQIFNVWLVLLTVEVAMGFGVRFGESMTKVPKLAPYDASFGYALAHLFHRFHEGSGRGVQFKTLFLDPLFWETFCAASLLVVLFFSIWCIQVGVVNLRRAGGLKFIQAQIERAEL